MIDRNHPVNNHFLPVAAQRTKPEQASAFAHRGSRVDLPATYHAEGTLSRPAEPLALFKSSRNSDAGSTLVTSKWSRARVQAT